MAVRLRLTRVGGKKDPVWRVVVADQRSPRDGRVIETIGHYNAQTEPSTVVIDEERARLWIERGAQPSKVVRKLLRIRESAEASDAGAVAQEPPSSVSDEAVSVQAADAADGEDAAGGPGADPGAAEADAGGAA